MKEQNYHMSPEEFRKYGYKVIDEIVEYYKKVEELPILPNIEFGDILEKLPKRPPLEGEDFDSIISDVKDIIIPGLTHWQSPNFFAYFPSNTSFPSILGELFSAGFGVQGMLWLTSPACTELEIRVMDWVVQLLGLPEKFTFNDKGGGVIQDSASSAALCAIIAARESITNSDINKYGFNKRLTAYVSDQTHSSVIKGLKIAGIGEENICYVKSDAEFKMDVSALEEKIKNDREGGKTPFFCCATIGTTSTMAIDPVLEIGKVCNRYGLWLHIDAAMAGTALLCDEYKYLLNGVSLANSFCFNPHKWMFTNFDCDCFFVDDRKKLISALTILPEYLKNISNKSLNEVIDYRDWQIPLGRRFRALKLWFVIRHYGKKGLEYHIRKHISLAALFEDIVNSSNDFEIVSKRSLNLVCFRHKKGNDFNKKLLKELNLKGKIFLSHSTMGDLFFLRFCVGQSYTEREHILEAWHHIEECSNKLLQ
ncbi:MAG: aminotransferase class I/II-fold pyridoxal phosphate-dependent enzyme [Deferribacterota bacterium]|nr:aminotransferase class I/II-fold pyridoxal phosphate-dependent enzyme [Deferribacterota bacterium]